MDLPRYTNDPEAFFREQIILEDIEEPFGNHAADWQIQVALQAVAGERRFSWVEAVRGAAKTFLLAMAMLYRIVFGGRDLRIFVIAADQDQAAQLMDELKGFLFRNPELAAELERDGLKVFTSEVRYPAMNSTLLILTTDEAGSWGMRPTDVVADELSWWPKAGHFNALFSAMAKRKGARFFCITNAGEEGGWAWDLREAIREDPDWYFRRIDPTDVSWRDEKALAVQRRTMPPSLYARVHENVWTPAGGGFFEAAQITACLSEFDPQAVRVEMTEVVLGADLGVRHDASVLSVVGRNEGGYHILAMETFEPPHGGEVNLDLVEERILALYQTLSCRRALADPWEGRGMLQRLRGRIQIEEFTISAASRERLSRLLYEVVATGRLKFLRGTGGTPGSEWTLERELRELVTRERARSWGFDHRPNGHDDRTMATTLALHGLNERIGHGPQIFIFGDEVQEESVPC